jgi:hypothetical protein
LRAQILSDGDIESTVELEAEAAAARGVTTLA